MPGCRGDREDRIQTVCAVTVDGQNLLATGGSDGMVRLWNARTGEQLTSFGDREDRIQTVCAVSMDGQNLLATGSDDGWVRLWDPQTRRCLVTIPTHHPVSGVAAVGDSLAIGFSFGILVIKLNVAAQPPASWGQSTQTGRHLRVFHGPSNGSLLTDPPCDQPSARARPHARRCGCGRLRGTGLLRAFRTEANRSPIRGGELRKREGAGPSSAPGARKERRGPSMTCSRGRREASAARDIGLASS